MGGRLRLSRTAAPPRHQGYGAPEKGRLAGGVADQRFGGDVKLPCFDKQRKAGGRGGDKISFTPPK